MQADPSNLNPNLNGKKETHRLGTLVLFFEHLLVEHAANRALSRPPSSTLATVEDVFRKSSSKRHARMVLRDDVEGRFGFGSEISFASRSQ